VSVKIVKITALFKKIILVPLYLYRYFISPVLGPNCRYLPSCSDYCQQAIEKHGIIRGILLSSIRILKCNPFGKSGLDPVPDKFCILRKKTDE